MTRLGRARFAVAATCAAVAVCGLDHRALIAAPRARPHVVLVIGEDEYDTEHTLTAFARDAFEPRTMRCTSVSASHERLNDFAGIEALESADLMILSVRRRTPIVAQMNVIRKYFERGEPLVAIRTASHAFALRDGESVPAGHAQWPEFDRDVLGGNYRGHHNNKEPGDPRTFVRIAPAARKHPIVRGLAENEFFVRSWLYKTAPLAQGTTLLMTGRVEGRPDVEPVAWTNRHRGGRVFYTSLGHPDDFKMPQFRRMLLAAVEWALAPDAAGPHD